MRLVVVHRVINVKKAFVFLLVTTKTEKKYKIKEQQQAIQHTILYCIILYKQHSKERKEKKTITQIQLYNELQGCFKE